MRLQPQDAGEWQQAVGARQVQAFLHFSLVLRCYIERQLLLMRGRDVFLQSHGCVERCPTLATHENVRAIGVTSFDVTRHATSVNEHFAATGTRLALFPSVVLFVVCLPRRLKYKLKYVRNKSGPGMLIVNCT